MKKSSSLGTCFIPVTLRCGEKQTCTRGDCLLRVLISVVSSQEDPLVLNEYREDLRTECEKFGVVKKVILFDVSFRHSSCFKVIVEQMNLTSVASINYWYLIVFALQRHPDGVASIAFKEPEEADACIQSFNGRWFGGRQLTAQLWDGTTDYQVHKMQKCQKCCGSAQPS